MVVVWQKDLLATGPVDKTLGGGDEEKRVPPFAYVSGRE